ncbi:MAG: DNA cytosine methyltransferase [Rhodocyclaceae bacterium]|nr:DNA cytosine methyltransferase [Rhodocyclaceae bacterium]
MKHLDLFSGIGGFALAARWAGIETVAFCEIEEFPRKVLAKNFPGVPIHHDIHDLDGSEYAGIDLITGGYPCQPFSLAGKRRGTEDDRHLWPEMRRVIAHARPAWVVCENVYGHITMGLDEMLHDLEGEGYAARPFVVPAAAVGADHRRDRVWVVANASSGGEQQSGARGNERRLQSEILQGRRNRDYFKIAPRADRVADGLPRRVDRIRGLGNAIVPQVAYEILRTIRAV